ncbi:MAG: signal recognition particle-docking protein FtsY [Acidobacteria bacterium RIFCSPLOWO2_02_FULL_61_28]|nr:MAG: signal recognition particle-docking protein FtsY [Acidobacteria bacterium RIFCSPLOWO2_02_FULL_61_28]
MIQTLFGSPEAKPGLLERFQKAVQSTRSSLVSRVEDLVRGKTEIDAKLLEELEETLIAGDVGVGTAQEVLEAVRGQVSRGQLQEPSRLKSAVKAELLNILKQTADGLPRTVVPPVVILVVGVNGTGKTTTIGKLAFQLRAEGKTVLLCAGDTFRAAATEQLEIWGERTGCEVVKQRPGADPSAVLFDALTSAKARQFDYIIADTAGRLHTKVNLMAELEKMRRTSQRIIPGSPHEVLLVLDATTGQNGLQQARQFTGSAGITGIVLTKLDGTAKGGGVIAIARELKLPIRYVGVGEQKEDLLPFDPEQFIESLFS